jgi:hypothetical protein
VSALDREAIAKVDSAGMLDDMLGQPHQLEDALWRVESAGIGALDAPGGLVVCGMGGSAIGGDLAAGAIGDRATTTLRRGSRTPPPSCARATRATRRRRSPPTRPRAIAAPAGS